MAWIDATSDLSLSLHREIPNLNAQVGQGVRRDHIHPSLQIPCPPMDRQSSPASSAKPPFPQVSRPCHLPARSRPLKTAQRMTLGKNNAGHRRTRAFRELYPRLRSSAWSLDSFSCFLIAALSFSSSSWFSKLPCQSPCPCKNRNGERPACRSHTPTHLAPNIIRLVTR